MRPILVHERKLISQLLQLADISDLDVPESVDLIHVLDAGCSLRGVTVNESFSCLFEGGDLRTRCLARVAYSIALPYFLGNDLFLVKSLQTNRLVMLEFYASGIGSKKAFIEYLSELTVLRDKNLDDAVTRMISDACDLGASIRARKNQRNRALRYLRIFVVNDALLFFLTTGRKILQEGYCESTEWSESTFQVELLRRDEEVAVDGWLALG